MEEESMVKRPADRRLGDTSTLPPGPPGAEFDTDEFALKNAPPTAAVTKKNDNSSSERLSRRRSPSGSPASRKRRSKSRGRRTPTPPRNRTNRSRRSPSPMRRNRYSDYSPNRRRFGRRSPERRRYGSRGMGRDRYRGRGRSSSRSLSRSPTPSARRGGRWSPKKKPSSPPPPQPTGLVQPPAVSNQPPPPPYAVMAPQMYGDAYGTNAGYNQYGVPPPQTGFVPSNEAYASTGFNTAYPPPSSWGVDAYGQQQWMPPPNQIRQMPPPQQTQPSAVPADVSPLTSTPTATTSIPPPVTMTKSVHILPDVAPGTMEANPQHDPVAQEAENQRDEIRKQRASYLKKTAVLKMELKMLKEQRRELHSGKAPASPTTKGFIDENEKLQSQIQKKLNTIGNVIDMLTGIIGEDNLDKDDEPTDDAGLVPRLLKDGNLAKSLAPSGSFRRTVDRNESALSHSDKKTRSSSSSSEESSSDSSSSSSESSSTSDNETKNKPDNDDDSTPERLKMKVIESMKNKERESSRMKQIDVKIPTKKERFNYVFYDPEMHWCQTCNIFPKTAKDYLNHLHSKDHMDRETIETPWHADMVSDQFPSYENVPTKRTPIRGLTFFVPATSWFCKLCSIWMGDLHCASTHLKSQLHANKYNSFLEENPHYEVNWLADRQRVLNDQKLNPLPQQITSVSTTAAERKKSKKDDEKASKKRKKKSEKKQKKKKKKSNKKRKRNNSESSSSSSDSSSPSETGEPKKKTMPSIEVKDLDNPNPAVSIRLSMRKQEIIKQNDTEVPQAPPPPILKAVGKNEAPAGGKWTVVQEGVKTKTIDGEDDGIMQEWNTVQPVISESEKKLLEELKGRLKNKSNNDQHSVPYVSNTASTAANISRNDVEKETRGKGERFDRRDNRENRENRDNRDGPDARSSRRRSLSRSPTRSRSRGRDYRRHMRRSRTRSRGRMSPRGGWRGRRRQDRSRSRSLRRRSRSNDRRRRSSRSRSPSRGRVEKPIVRQPEFRPRVPEKDKEKEKKNLENKEKKEKAKLKAATVSSTATNNNSGKKLPFIGKMPVFKKQASGQLAEGEKQQGEQQLAAGYMYPMDASAYSATQQRPPAPTAAQIQMAMMEDAYGNAPPFHPDAGMLVDYDDLMPDPVQFVNIMGQAPPPPPPQASDDKEMLPPGIDEEESEQFMPKPIIEAPPPPPPGKGVLPKDLEDALNIIFPGDKKPEDEDKIKSTKGETQIIDDDPKFEPEELAKDGIHMVTLEETSQLGIDEASQMSMNEPLVFNRPGATATLLLAADMDIEDSNSRISMESKTDQSASPVETTEDKQITSALSPNIQNPLKEDSSNLEHSEQIVEANTTNVPAESISIPERMPIILENITHENIPANLCMSNNAEKFEAQPARTDEPSDLQLSTKDEANHLETEITEIDLADIPQPPPSPTESEKNRRQEELDDLAMLGIDADDMAAQCM